MLIGLDSCFPMNEFFSKRIKMLLGKRSERGKKGGFILRDCESQSAMLLLRGKVKKLSGSVLSDKHTCLSLSARQTK